MAFQHTVLGGMSELGANQKFFEDASTMTQTGAAFASPVASAVVGGLKQSVTSANDAIKTYFFEKNASQIFENIWIVRKNLVDLLTCKELKKNEAMLCGKSQAESSNKDLPNYNYSESGMKYADLVNFMKIYDRTCLFEQAVNNLNTVTDAGQSKASRKGDDQQDSASGTQGKQQSPAPESQKQVGENPNTPVETVDRKLKPMFNDLQIKLLQSGGSTLE